MASTMFRLTFIIVALTCSYHLFTADALHMVTESEESEIRAIFEDSDSILDEFGHMLKKPEITSMHVDCDVSLRYTKTVVTSKVSNPANKSNEAVFSMVIPETAFISGFSMEIYGKIYNAYVKEKAEAKRIYQAAVNRGVAAAHVAVKARDSNHFVVSVNLEPKSKAVFQLCYEELLTRRLSLYNLVMNLNPGQLLDDLRVEVKIHESSPIKELRMPGLRTGNEVDAEAADPGNEFVSHTISEDRLEATVVFTPSRAQQLELLNVFKEKERKKSKPSHRPYPFDTQPASGDREGLTGQFVVQYDVDRDLRGQVLLNDGYFVHFFAPNDLKPLNKHVLFVLDVSDSMLGRKMEQLKEAMKHILQDLHTGDYFTIIEFSSTVKVSDIDVLHKKSEYFSEENVDESHLWYIPPPKQHTPENIEKAKRVISLFEATGYTNIHGALMLAIQAAIRGSDDKSLIASSSGSRTLPSPMIIFLTDGEPTTGITNLDAILSAVRSKNTINVPIYSLAFGRDADRDFLRKLSLQNDGFMRHIYEAADAAQQLRHFYRQVASPLLTNVTLTYAQDQIDEASLTEKTFKYYFRGSELVLAGRVITEMSVEPSLKLTGESYSGPMDFVPHVQMTGANAKFWPLERLWAYLTITQLLDEKDRFYITASTGSESPSDKALRLALKYSFVTPLTSLVVVKPNNTLHGAKEELVEAKKILEDSYYDSYDDYDDTLVVISRAERTAMTPLLLLLNIYCILHMLLH